MGGVMGECDLGAALREARMCMQRGERQDLSAPPAGPARWLADGGRETVQATDDP